MIPHAEIISWRNNAPWAGFDQVEHDLVLSRALCELYKNPLISESLVFRGGTALHKLFFKMERTGIELHKIDGINVPIYCAAKTVADCFKFRNRVGITVAIEALKDYWAQPNNNIKNY